MGPSFSASARTPEAKKFHVGDEAPGLDREDETFGRFVVPFLVAAWALQRVEGAVDLD
jgi:hypothetical protein